MLRIKMTVNSSGVYLNGIFADSKGNKGSINKCFQSEDNAWNEIHEMRDRDCEFSLTIQRKV
jgi:hypothetical protein